MANDITLTVGGTTQNFTGVKKLHIMEAGTGADTVWIPATSVFTIDVTTTYGRVAVYATCGDTSVYTITDNSGHGTINIPFAGTWTLSASGFGTSGTATVVVSGAYTANITMT